MALNASGPISLAGTAAGQSIQLELGGTGITQISLNDASVRTLAGVVSGQIAMPTNFYGKSNSLIQQGSKLVGTGGTVPTYQGWSVSLSADGNTLAVGGPYDNSSAGAIWIFTRSGSTWTQQGSKLVGTGAIFSPRLGHSVSLSADGNTLAAGGWADDSNIGATWIFTRSGSTWTQQGSKLVGTGATANAVQGYAVSLSADGNTLAVGGQGDSTNAGATWIFTRSGSTWTQQGSKLVGTGASAVPVYQGCAVSLSSDGNILAVGGYGDSTNAGATWIFTRSGSTWTQQGSKIVGTGNTSFSQQGFAVSLSSDGNTLAVGGYGDSSSSGATWIFTRSGSTWTQQGSKLVGTGNTGAARQGYAVSLSSDGNKLAEAGYADAINIGATWIFTRSGSTWTQQGSKLVGTGATGKAFQGYSVSLNGNGNTVAVSGYQDSTNIGATWIFA